MRGTARSEGRQVEGPYRRIACCIEQDDMAAAVVREGLRVADGDGERLSIVHVIAPPHPYTVGLGAYVPPAVESQAQADAWLSGVAAAVPGATPVLLAGFPGREVAAWAAAEAIDLIVAAARRGLVERALSGGFAAHLAHHAPCPLLILPRPATVVVGAPAGRRAAPPA